MKLRVAKITIVLVPVLALGFLFNSCGSQTYCPTCGTTVNGAYAVLDVIPVPEHNPTGEPGGPFNSFDISWWDPNLRRAYTSDRIGLDIVVTDTVADAAIGTIGGLNEVAEAGNNASPCWGPQNVPAATSAIPSIITGVGSTNPGRVGNGLTRFGCRNAPYFAAFGAAFPGFGPNGFFGGFVGAQCCASRANGVNPISGPDGNLVTPDGKTLFVGNGSATVVAFDLTTGNFTSIGPTVLAAFPTGSSPDFDGPVGVAPCIASWNGGAGTDPTCADDRSDEMTFGVAGPAGSACPQTIPISAPCHGIVAVSNGDPALPLFTLIDVTDIVNRTFAPPFTVPNSGNPAATGFGHCLPLSYPAFNVVGTAADNYFPGKNPPACILGQIYYDGAPGPAGLSSTVPVDSGVVTGGIASTPCPDPSTAVPSGVSGTYVPTTGPLTGVTVNIPCHHGPIVDSNTGFFITNNGTTALCAAGETCQQEFAVAGMGATVFNPFHQTFYEENLNCTVSNLATQSSVAVGCIDEVDPRIGNPDGPVVINVVPTINCMPAGIVQGPGHDFLIGCGGHDGTQFPPLLIIFDGACTTSAACVASETSITQSGGTDEVWFNPGDNRYYTAGRDMPNGPVMGVVDAPTRTWLVNVPTGSNAHSVTVDAVNNHAIVPLQAGARCTTQSSNGCIAVYGRQ